MFRVFSQRDGRGHPVPFYSTLDAGLIKAIKPSVNATLDGSAINTSAVARLIFAEGSGTTVKNLVSGSTLPLVGSPTWVAGADNGQCLSTTTQYQGVDASSLAKLSGQITVFIRVNLANVTDSSQYVYGDWGTSYRNFFCNIETGIVKLYNGNSGTSQEAALVGPTLAASTVYNIAFVRDATNLRIYLNGIQSVTATKTYSGGTTANSPAILNAVGFSGSVLRGTTETVGLWSRALSASEISTLQTNPYAGITG